MQGLRGQVYPPAAAVGGAVDQMPGLQEAGPAGLVHVQLSQDGFDLRRQKSRVYGPQASFKRGIRETVMPQLAAKERPKRFLFFQQA